MKATKVFYFLLAIAYFVIAWLVLYEVITPELRVVAFISCLAMSGVMTLQAKGGTS